MPGASDQTPAQCAASCQAMKDCHAWMLDNSGGQGLCYTYPAKAPLQNCDNQEAGYKGFVVGRKADYPAKGAAATGQPPLTWGTCPA